MNEKLLNKLQGKDKKIWCIEWHHKGTKQYFDDIKMTYYEAEDLTNQHIKNYRNSGWICKIRKAK